MMDRLPGDTSQNCESTRLWNAVGGDHGFYIDIGAGHPIDLNVTNLFYNRGWTGINIEPGPYGILYQSARVQDQNAEVAISCFKGALPWSDSPVHPDLSGHTFAGERRLPCNTLASFSGFIHQEVSFIKVDVEGTERDVLIGNDWQAIRPLVWCIEAIDATTLQQNNEHWEWILLDNGYECAYFDGINRFYYRNDRPELAERLQVELPTLREYPR